MSMAHPLMADIKVADSILIIQELKSNKSWIDSPWRYICKIWWNTITPISSDLIRGQPTFFINSSLSILTHTLSHTHIQEYSEQLYNNVKHDKKDCIHMGCHQVALVTKLITALTQAGINATRIVEHKLAKSKRNTMLHCQYGRSPIRPGNQWSGARATQDG